MLVVIIKLMKYYYVPGQVSFGYTPEKKIFQKMSISADLESRIALVWNAEIDMNATLFSLIPRLFPPPVFAYLKYAETEGKAWEKESCAERSQDSLSPSPVVCHITVHISGLPCFCVLHVIKNWRPGQPGNEARQYYCL